MVGVNNVSVCLVLFWWLNSRFPPKENTLHLPITLELALIWRGFMQISKKQLLPHPTVPPATSLAEHLHILDKHGAFKTSSHMWNSKIKEIGSALNHRVPTDASVKGVTLALQLHWHISAWGHHRSKAHIGKISQCDKKCRRIVQFHPEEMLHPITIILITCTGLHLIPLVIFSWILPHVKYCWT